MSTKALDGIKNILLDLDAKISHIEDIEADNRKIIVKLVKQNNAIVKFLNSLEINEVDVTEEKYELMDTGEYLNKEDLDNMKDIKELINEYMNKAKDLQELDEELEKHKDDITPGKIGEA